MLISAGLCLCLLQSTSAEPDTVTQFSTIDALLAGVYEGVASFESVLNEGDFGLGTVEDLDGELVILEGVAYQVRADGTCLLYTSPSPRDRTRSRMPSSA